MIGILVDDYLEDQLERSIEYHFRLAIISENAGHVEQTERLLQIAIEDEEKLKQLRHDRWARLIDN